jgi:hypothetical protein
MLMVKANPVNSFANLKDRVERFFKVPVTRAHNYAQLRFDLAVERSCKEDVVYPSKNVAEFLGFISAALPDGEIYLFGGILRDLALLGRKGFNSDIDLVVEGNWGSCIAYLQSLGARRNKFGGFRLTVGGWPIDIWNARDTWAIKQGLVSYVGIASLTETTVLNWDAILMNWRTRNFIYRKGYLESLRERLLDIVLEANPNPFGMAVRVFRHLCIKDAKKISPAAAVYLANCTNLYTFEDIAHSEIRSYGNSFIDLATYKFFERLKIFENLDIRTRFDAASESLEMEGIKRFPRQGAWLFER